MTTFTFMEFSSKLLEKAVNEMAQLPGIGKRTALRLVLHLLKQPKEHTGFLTQSLTTMREEVKFCISCHNISDIDITKIDHAFITDYEFWLRSVRNCANNTAVKYLKNFNKIIKLCLANDWLDKNPFANYKSNDFYHVL